MIAMKKNLLCPCKSQKQYSDCCEPFHLGKAPDTALELMRSRYSAYAMHLADYIMQTTHKDNLSYKSPHSEERRKEILEFSKATDFVGLKILEFIDGENEAYVTFTAYLKQGGKDVSFTEKSYFVRVQNQWLYKEGKISPATLPLEKGL
jgi:SEC-C motif-containing protein